MKRGKSILCLTLALLLSGLLSCKADPVSGDPSDVPMTAATQSQSEGITDSLPGNLDFDGEALNLLIRVDFNEEFFAEEVTGDVVNDRSEERRVG